MRDFHSRIVKLDDFAKFQTTNIQDMVSEKIKEQSAKIVTITETFREALILSNKTYFLEEMSKQKGIQKDLRKEIAVYKERIKTQES